MQKSPGETKESKLNTGLNRVWMSKGTTVVIVTMALLLDNMLLTVIFPIIPEFLYSIEHKNIQLNSTSSTSISLTDTNTENSLQETEFRTTSFVGPRSLPNVSMPLKHFQNSDLRLNENIFHNNEHLDANTNNIYRPHQGQYPRISEELHHNESTNKATQGKKISGESFEVGILLASKAVVQLLVNPFIGYLTDRIGYKTPMLSGFSIMFISTLAFAFGTNYYWLFFARAFQGIGSSCASVSGMAVLAQSYPDYNERGNVMGIALSGGIALGVLIGPTFGGFMYEFVGKSSPFLILAILSSIGALLQMCIVYPEVKQTNKDVPSMINLIQDPYILIVTGSLIIANMAVAMLQSSLPIIMMDRMEVDLWQIGATFLPCSLSYMIGTCVFARIASCIGRWLTCLLGLYFIGSAFVFVIFAYTPEFLIGPMALTGFGIGMVDSSMLPELGNLVDLRHSAKYGSVYAMGDIAICLGFAVGPALSGGLAKLIGFKWMAVFTSLICFVYGPLLFILKNPQGSSETDEKEELPLIDNNYDQHGPKYDISNDEIMGTSQHN